MKSFDPNFNFWSCADVDVLESPNHFEKCSGNGKYLDEKCVCDDGNGTILKLNKIFISNCELMIKLNCFKLMLKII